VEEEGDLMVFCEMKGDIWSGNDCKKPPNTKERIKGYLNLKNKNG